MVKMVPVLLSLEEDEGKNEKEEEGEGNGGEGTREMSGNWEKISDFWVLISFFFFNVIIIIIIIYLTHFIHDNF